MQIPKGMLQIEGPHTKEEKADGALIILPKRREGDGKKKEEGRMLSHGQGRGREKLMAREGGSSNFLMILSYGWSPP